MEGRMLNVMQAFPWLNGVILATPVVDELRRREELRPYTASIQAILDKLDHPETYAFLQDSLKTTSVTQTLIDGRLGAFSTLTAEKLSKLVAVLLDYRFLDVAIFLQVGHAPAGQPARLPIPLPPKMHFKQMSDWPGLVSRGLQLLLECEDEDIISESLPTNPTQSIFSSLLHRKESIDAHKIMSNFECTAAHMSLMLKGVVDLPNRLEDFKALVLELCSGGTTTADRWEAFFDHIKSPHNFKLPLHIALACSPVCLFLPSSLMTKDLNRLLLLQMWQGLGGHRPEPLQVIEGLLWRALFESALGISTLSTRLKSAFQGVRSVDLSQIGYPSLEWLNGDSSWVQTKIKKRPTNPQPVQEETASTNLGARIPAMPSPGPTPGRTTRSQTAKPEPWSPSVGKVTPDGRVPRAPTKVGQAPTRPRRRQGSAVARGKRRAISEPPSTTDESDEMETDDDTYTGEGAVNRKRTISALSTASEPNPELGVKALKLEDGSRHMRVYETIDLSREAVGPPVIDLILEDEDSNGERFPTTPYLLWDSRSALRHAPKFHFRPEADWFTALFRNVQGCQPGQTPQFLADKAASFFTVLSDSRAKEMGIEDMQETFRKRAIVVTGTSHCIFDSKSVGTFSMLDKVVSIQDLSIAFGGDRVTTGTLTQLLHFAESGARSLTAFDVPIPGGAGPLQSLASDVHSWDMTIDQAWCSRRWELPRSAVRWAEISTCDSYRPLAISSNGFATQIEVKAGSQLLVVCQPSPFNPHSMSSMAMLESFRNPYIADNKTFDFQAIHLKAGYTAVVKPLMPFMILSTSNSIAQMSHFYASSTLQASCVGFWHSSVTADSGANQSQRASQSLLRRMVHYFHLVYTSDSYVANRHNYPHVPDVLTFTGVLDVLSLCNIFEVMTALTHTLSDLDRHLFIEARRLCRRMVAWMEACFVFTDRQGRRVNLTTDFWVPYLSHQLNVIQGHQKNLQQRGLASIDSASFRRKLESSVRNNPSLRFNLANPLAVATDDLEWTAHPGLSVSTRLPPGAIPGDIRGETGDDLDHFGSGS